MPRFNYSQQMLRYLEKGYKEMSVPGLTESFNKRFGTSKSKTAIKSVLSCNNFTCGRRTGGKKGEGVRLLSPGQVEFVQKEYRSKTRKELLAAVNEKFGLSLRLTQLVAFLKNHKIHSGRTGQYEKGSVPFNAGTTGFMKKNSGSFRKGNKPVNYQPIGYERVCRTDGYVLIKVAERNPWNDSPSGWYRLKHIVIWEEHHGPVPEGFCLRFIDGNPGNVQIENLAMVSRGENARLNQMKYNSQVAEVKPVIMAMAKLDQAVSERSK